ncbi:tetratricopeptide repeat protein [Deinococcus yavapaiensis]|uniref:Uncharacterized protein n=1 Tax=Deinococcus yavapaiensis KR-236 TaxID=694435 RepID=A0A318SD50_9DEIO|nr:tetratricopeptide repeat protein [Deinococcus yavapaiensis]PYE49957.1 hypothetical protein DES52_12042 [Deinococcus yavapaiensis KR-236]
MSKGARRSVEAKEAVASVEALVERGEFELAYRTVEVALREPLSVVEQQTLLDAVSRVPLEQRAGSAAGALITARLLGNTRQAADVLPFTALARQKLGWPASAPAAAFEAFALVREGRHDDAVRVADEVIAVVDGLPLGIAWRARAEALGWSGRDGWREAFRVARTHLTGRSLGTCWLAEGTLMHRAGDDAGAQAAWREALLLLERDPLYAAWLRHALGLSYLRFGLPEAEEHFLALERLSKREGAAHMRARALCGLGTARRVRGEWDRALSSYRAALRVAREEDDVQQARRSLGHTLRLLGKPGLALEELLRAARAIRVEAERGKSWVYVDVAAAHLALGNDEAARDALAHVEDGSEEDAQRGSIVRAELARRAGDEEEARRELRKIRTNMMWAREEVVQFPALFALMGGERPVPLTHLGGTRVEVRALGALEVQVNGRVIPMRATGRAGELLVVLLEKGGRATTEELTDALYRDDAPERRRAGQSLWALAKTLREALGWEGSVTFVGGAYHLDEAAQWWYDVREAVARGERTPAFLSGVYSAWAVERAQELALRDEALSVPR